MDPGISYPTLSRRYLTTAIDGCVILGGLLLASYVVQGDSAVAQSIRISTILFLFLVYEPLCTSRLCTIGQKLMGVRVRDYATSEHITIPQAYFRILVKLVLGVVSFFTIGFNPEHRAIHDMAARSIV